MSFRKFFIGITVGVVVLASTLLTAILLPGAWFNRPVLSFILPKVLPRVGVGLQWQFLEASTQGLPGGRRRFRLALHDVQLSNLPVKGQVELAEAEVTLKWLALPPRLEAIEKLHGRSSRLAIVETPSSAPDPSASEKTTSSPIPDLRLAGYVPEFIRRVEIGDVRVQVDTFAITDGLGPVRAVLAADASEGGRALRLQAQTSGEGKPTLSAAAVFPLSAERFLVLSRARIDGQADLDIGRVQARLALRDCEKTATCGDLEASLTPPKRNDFAARARISLVIRGDTAHLELSGSGARLHPWLPVVAAESPCAIDLDARKADELRAQLKCGIQASLRIPPVRGVPHLRLPTRTRLGLEGAAKLEKLSGDPRLSGSLALDTTPVLKPLLESTIRSKSDFHAVLSELSKAGIDGFHHETELRIEARVPEIDAAEKLLHDTPWAIPAPANNLDGALTLSLEARWKDWSTTAPFKLRTQLESPQQALDTHAEGEFDFQLRPRVLARIKAEAILDRVRLSAPRLDLPNVPRFFPDSLVQPFEETSASPEPSAFAYDITVRTPEREPLRIDTNLVPKPLAFDIRARVRSDAPLEASVRTRPFDFEKFRQVAHVEKLRIDLDAASKSPRLDVRAGIPKGDYRIYITVAGPTDKAKIAVSSEPPAPQDEVWALLLYGEPMGALDIDQQANAQSSRQAISRGAFGIFSLIALASTPIERIDYDPVTKRASARFHVAQGTSLEVGRSEAEGSSLGLRKRLGRGWAVNAQVSSLNQEERKSAEAGASLEWSSRY